LRARYYDQATGRFNRLDPFFGNLIDPLSLHKYLYTHNDLINGIDPSGKAAFLVPLLWALGGLIGGATIGGVVGAGYAAMRGLQGEHFWSTVRAGAAIGGVAGLSLMAP
jgi:hypothetical protein